MVCSQLVTKVIFLALVDRRKGGGGGTVSSGGYVDRWEATKKGDCLEEKERMYGRRKMKDGWIGGWQRKRKGQLFFFVDGKRKRKRKKRERKEKRKKRDERRKVGYHSAVEREG